MGMRVNLPEKFFSKLIGALTVGVRKIIAGWRGCPTNGRQRTGMKLQPIANFIESNATRQLSIHHGHGMTLGTEQMPLFLNFSLPTKSRNQMGRNQIAKLVQDGKVTSLGLSRFFFFIPVVWRGKTPQFKLFSKNYGMAVKFNQKNKKGKNDARKIINSNPETSYRRLP